jgi:hypothetical protein
MKDIQQLIKKNSQEGRYEDIFPKTFIDAVLDKESRVTLTDILAMFNMLFLSYNGSRSQTRLQVPSSLRREGLWVTYVLYDKTVVTEWYSAEAIDDTTFGDSANWRDGSNALVGDISISSDGYWVINGEVTNIKAQGEAGITPILRVGSNNHLQVSYTDGSSYVDVSPNPVFTQFRVSNNKLEQSVDLGLTWTVASNYIAAWFRFTGTAGSSQADNVGKIQISRDNGATWSDLSGEFTNSLHIKGYVATVDALPSTAVQGDIYGVGPTYDPSDTEHTNPIYQLYVKNSTGWVNNGRFTSIAAGVVQELGNSETEVISQKTLSTYISDVTKRTTTLLRTSLLGEIRSDPDNLAFNTNAKLLGNILVLNYDPYIFQDNNRNNLCSLTFPVKGGTTYTLFQDLFTSGTKYPTGKLGVVALVNKDLEGRTYSKDEDFAGVLLDENSNWVAPNYWQFTPSADGYLIMTVDIAQTQIGNNILGRLMIYEGTEIKPFKSNVKVRDIEELKTSTISDNSFHWSTAPYVNKIGIFECYNMYLSTGRFFSSPGTTMISGIAKVEPGKTYAFIGLDVNNNGTNGGFILANDGIFNELGEVIPNNSAIVQDVSTSFSRLEGHETENIHILTIPQSSEEELYIVFILEQDSSYYCYNHRLANFISIQEFTDYEHLDFHSMPINAGSFFKNIEYSGKINCYNPEKNFVDGYYVQTAAENGKLFLAKIDTHVYEAVAIPVIPLAKYTIKTANDLYENSHNVVGFTVRDIDNMKMAADDSNRTIYTKNTLRLKWEDCPIGKNGVGRTVTVPYGYNYLIFNGFSKNIDNSQSKYDIKVCVGDQIVDEEFDDSSIYGTRDGLFPQGSYSNESGLNQIDTKMSWCTIGDSITWINDNYIYGYQRTVMKAFKFSNYYNEGQNGWKMLQYADALLDGSKVLPKADIYTIGYGINDFAYGNPVGTLDDFKNNTGSATYAGALRVIIDKIYEVNIDALIFIMTPRKACKFNNYLPNEWYEIHKGVYLTQYADILNECASWFSLPVIDIFSLSQANEVTLENLSYDVALHPNQKGCDLMAALIIGKFRECLPLYKG